MLFFKFLTALLVPLAASTVAMAEEVNGPKHKANITAVSQDVSRNCSGIVSDLSAPKPSSILSRRQINPQDPQGPPLPTAFPLICQNQTTNFCICLSAHINITRFLPQNSTASEFTAPPPVVPIDQITN
ncbi:hypothetical protein BGW80DRAFT_1327765 [Lactifluus volemus]|nr:hypothetical protein BGW80DRAFT_1327765 [Lactifluus volemus]